MNRRNPYREDLPLRKHRPPMTVARAGKRSIWWGVIGMSAGLYALLFRDIPDVGWPDAALLMIVYAAGIFSGHWGGYRDALRDAEKKQ